MGPFFKVFKPDTYDFFTDPLFLKTNTLALFPVILRFFYERDDIR